jgi:hypothetical protein
MPKLKVSFVKKSAVPPKMRAAAPGAPRKAATGTDFIIQDDETGTCTVFGVDSTGAQVDISAVATLAVTSSDPTKLSVAAPVGMTFAETAVAVSMPGTSVVLTAVATWNDGSLGPFTITLPCDVVAGPVTGLVIVPATPTIA